ncbi:MAG: hypothetical protein ACLTXH_03245 [Enterobacter hormaechei]
MQRSGMIIAGPLWGNFISRYVERTFRMTSPSRTWARAKCRPSASVVTDPPLVLWA